MGRLDTRRLLLPQSCPVTGIGNTAGVPEPLSIAMVGSRGLPATDGGVERAVSALSRELVARGHRVTVYGRYGYCARDREFFNGVRQVALPTISTKHLEAASHTALATLHAMRQRHDLMHFHASGPALFSLVPKTFGTASVATVHGLDWKREKWGLVARTTLKTGARIAATVPQQTIVVSQELHRSFAAAYDRRPVYIPNGVDLTELTRNAAPVDELRGTPFVLFLGRLVPEKQLHVLIKAFRSLNTDHRLVVTGSSSHSLDYVKELKRIAHQDSRVIFLGSRYGQQKLWLLRNARLFVQPSTIEGLPIALLEAMAMGRQTLVSDIPENLEAVTINGVPTGFIFRTGNTADLQRTLRVALEHSAVVDPKIADVVRRNYSWSRIADQTEAVYYSALGQETAPSDWTRGSGLSGHGSEADVNFEREGHQRAHSAGS